MKLRVFSAVQPTGRLHLGNYLGALRAAVRHTVAGFLACGVDPDKACVFAQSSVLGHARLGWIMTCMAIMGRLNRMT